MIAIHIDFETRSNVDLKRATTHIYATDPTTDVWCMAYAIGDGPVELWKLGEPFPEAILGVAASGKPYYFIAHNAHFELGIWNYLCVPRYGWPRLPTHRTYCTMAMAYAMALPGSLENAALATGMTERKDTEGRNLMLRMASPRRQENDGTLVWWDDETRRNRLYEYCKQDVVVERELEKRLKPLPAAERELWLIDYEINDRGLHVDIPAIERACLTIESEKGRLNEAMREATGGWVRGISDIINLTDFLRFSTGGKITGVAKSDLRNALADPLSPPQLARAIKLRQEGGKASVAKLKAMVDAASPGDHRVRGTLQYHGAGPGRWAARKIQVQNFPRGELKLTQDQVEDAIRHIDEPGYLSAIYGPPMSVISDCLRGLINAAPGHTLIAADYVSIEAIVLGWLAGEEKVLEIFRGKGKIYEHAAASIFNTDPGLILESDPRRQVGKTAVLALGYQGGVGAFQSMAIGMGVDMATALVPLLETSTDKQIAGAKALYETYLVKAQKQRDRGFAVDLIPYDAFIASDLTKRKWREANPAIVEFWYNLEGAAMSAVRTPKTVYEVKIPGSLAHRQIKFIKSGSFLWMRLPSGRNICYPYPKIAEVTPPWGDPDDADDKRPALVYMGVDSRTRSWGRQIAYGGLLAENATQGVARDFLVNGILRARKDGYNVVFHVHDEIVAEMPAGIGSAAALCDIITQRPVWGLDCPISAKGWAGERYRK